MTFELLPSVTPWVIAFVVVAALAATLTLGVLAESLVRNRRVRVARHESVRSYYTGRLALHH
jgi:hypothetical protein